MAKLALVALSLAAFLAFSSATTVTTTIVDHNDFGIICDRLPTTTTIVDHNDFGIICDRLPTTTTTIVEDNDFGIICDRLPSTTTTNGAMLGHPIGEDNPQEQCRRQIQGQQLNLCQEHLTQGISLRTNPIMIRQQQQQHLQQCCEQLKQIDQQCQCEAIQKVVQQATQQKQQMQGGQLQIQQTLRKAQMLPNQCNLQVQQCPIQIPRQLV